MVIIRYEPLFGAYLIMEDGELYAIASNNIKEILGGLSEIAMVRNSEYPKGVFSAPIKVQIQVTKACNLRCRTCAVFGGECNETGAQLTNEQIIQLLGQLATMGVLNVEWSGGEPLLRKDFWTFVQCATDLGIAQNLLTNGIYFSRKNLKTLSSFFRIQISLDGTGEIFNRIVGRNVWNMFLRSMDVIRDKKLNITMATVLQEENVNHLDEIIDFCISRNLPKLRISLQVPIGRSSHVSWKEYSRIIEQFRKYLPDLKKQAGDGGVELDTFLEKRICDDDTVMDVSHIVSPGGYSFLYIDALGDVYPFPFLTQPTLRLGSCISDDLQVIWLNSAVLDNIRRWTYQNTGCGKCRYECSFAERSLVLGFTGRIDGFALPHKECKTIKKERRYVPCQK
jgi:MoaA/NifB/PqqE/SkfB family radical SAM enzyme